MKQSPLNVRERGRATLVMRRFSVKGKQLQSFPGGSYICTTVVLRSWPFHFAALHSHTRQVSKDK